MRAQKIQSGRALTGPKPADPTPSPTRHTSGNMRNSVSESRDIVEV